MITFDGMWSGPVNIDQPRWKQWYIRRLSPFIIKAHIKNNLENPDHPRLAVSGRIEKKCRQYEWKLRLLKSRERIFFLKNKKGFVAFDWRHDYNTLDTFGNVLDMLCFHSARWPRVRCAKIRAAYKGKPNKEVSGPKCPQFLSRNTTAWLWWREVSWSIPCLREGFLHTLRICWAILHVQFSSVQSLSHVWLFVTPWTAALQASLSITNSWSCSNSCPSS